MRLITQAHERLHGARTDVVQLAGLGGRVVRVAVSVADDVAVDVGRPIRKVVVGFQFPELALDVAHGLQGPVPDGR